MNKTYQDGHVCDHGCVLNLGCKDCDRYIKSKKINGTGFCSNPQSDNFVQETGDEACCQYVCKGMKK